MPTGPTSSIVYFCILQVLTCQMNTGPPLHLLSISIEHCTFLHPPSADLSTTSTSVAKLLFGILISNGLSQIQDGGFGGGLCSPSQINQSCIKSGGDLMRFNEIWWDSVRFNEIQWDLLRISEIWWDLLRFDEICWGSIFFFEIQWDCVTLWQLHTRNG